jgi:hypothetical protein
VRRQCCAAHDFSRCEQLSASRTALPELEPVIEAWAGSAEFHELNAPAADDDIAVVEELLGRNFPAAFHALYEMSNGTGYLEGNIRLDRLRGRGRYESVATLSDDIREAGAPLPPEVVVFGGDGSDALFGLWLPKGRTPDAPAPVIELDVSGDPYALVGTDLARFLKGRTAYYLILIEADPSALDALGVPKKLRVPGSEADDDLFYALREWADPDLADPRANPYERPTSADELRRRYGADG